jgi:hypothetical protein
MFVLRFHRLVRETLNWTEAPSTSYVNTQMSILRKRDTQIVEYSEWGHDNEELHLYISNNYPAYFGVVLRIGEATMKKSAFNRESPCSDPWQACSAGSVIGWIKARKRLLIPFRIDRPEVS